MRKDTSKHPFEVRFNEMLKSARKAEKDRPVKPRSRDIPSHIRVRFDETQNMFGMYNYRLDRWVCEEFEEDHHVFRTEEQAIAWYKGLI